MSIIDELELKVKELEDELTASKAETSQALSFIADKFSSELHELMIDYKIDLLSEFKVCVYE